MTSVPHLSIGDGSYTGGVRSMSNKEIQSSSELITGLGILSTEFSTPEQLPMNSDLKIESSVSLPGPAEITSTAQHEFSTKPVGRRWPRKSAHPYRSLLACDLLISYTGFAPRNVVLSLESEAESSNDETVVARKPMDGRRRKRTTRKRAAPSSPPPRRVLRRRKLSDETHEEVDVGGGSDEDLDAQSGANSNSADENEDDKPHVQTPTPPVRRRRKVSSRKSWFSNSTGNSARKECVSCGVRTTPYWRDGWDSVSLCNACGIRYKKRKIACGSCNYVPRKEESYGACPQCNVGEFV